MGMTDDYLEALYRALYESELERSDKLDSQINLPTAVVTGLLAVSAFYFEHLPKLEWRPGVVLFLLILAVYVVSPLLAIYCLIRSYFLNEYDLLPPPEKVQENVDGLQAFYKAEFDADRDVDENVKADIQHNIVSVYKQSGSFNRRTNTTRIAWLHRATRWIIVSIITLIVSRVVYFFVAAESKPQEVRITGIAVGSEAHKVEIVGRDTQKVQVVGAPPVRRAEVVNPPQSQKVEVSGLPEVQKVEIVTPKKESK